MHPMPSALSARVSAARQAATQTVASQVAAVRERAAADGDPVAAALAFMDAGSSGATRVRPALERLRDLVAAGAGERLEVPSPERLARRDA
jgi:site-specific DNA recombinase